MKTAGWPEAILFDLDGTLVDSAPDIANALNRTLVEEGHPVLERGAVAKMIGGGVPVLIERALKALGVEADEAVRASITKRYLARYEAHATVETALMPGVADTLRELHARDVPLGVVTNKPGEATRTVLEHFGLLPLMRVVVGGDAGPAAKPAPGLLLLACEKLGLAPGAVAYVGDSENDTAAARSAGMPVVVVAGGYTASAPEALGADAVAGRMSDLSAALLAVADKRAAHECRIDQEGTP